VPHILACSLQPFPHHEGRSQKPFAERLDRAIADMNAFLLALAIGLAVLGNACFMASRSIDAIKLQLMQTVPLSGRAVAGGVGDAQRR
jgi:hypothetical protein